MEVFFLRLFLLLKLIFINNAETYFWSLSIFGLPSMDTDIWEQHSYDTFLF